MWENSKSFSFALFLCLRVIPTDFGTFVLSPPFEKTDPTNSHVLFQKEIKAYVGINRVCFSEEGGERTNVPKSVVLLSRVYLVYRMYDGA